MKCHLVKYCVVYYIVTGEVSCYEVSFGEVLCCLLHCYW